MKEQTITKQAIVQSFKQLMKNKLIIIIKAASCVDKWITPLSIAIEILSYRRID